VCADWSGMAEIAGLDIAGWKMTEDIVGVDTMVESVEDSDGVDFTELS